MFVLALTFQSTVTVVARLGSASTFCGTAILDWVPFEIHFCSHTAYMYISYIFIPQKLLRSFYIAENIEYLRNRSALAVSCEIKSRARSASDLSAYQ